jgi:hypothetical protein
MDNFLTFKKYNDIGLANEIGEQLMQENIEIKIVNDRKFFDPAFVTNTANPDILLQIKSTDFTKAQQVVNDYYKVATQSVAKDYYLFEFTNDELYDIIAKPDEWGEYDYQLAKKMLKDKGIEIKPETINLLAQQRLKKLSLGEPNNKNLIYFGYFLILFVGLFALIIGNIYGIIMSGFIGTLYGYFISYTKKTLPIGEQVFIYNSETRKQGKTIILVAVIFVALSIGLLTILKSTTN